MIKDSIELMNKKQKLVTNERNIIPLKARMTSNIPQLRKGLVVKPSNNSKTIVKKKPTDSTPKKPTIIQSSKEYPQILEELLWKTPVDKCQKITADIPNAMTTINYVDMINELNSICYVSLEPTLRNTENAYLKDEYQIREIKQKIHDINNKLQGLYEKNQSQLDIQRAMLSYLKIHKSGDIEDTIAELYKTNEIIMLIINEIVVLNQQAQQLESQYTHQLVNHLTHAINEEKQKIKRQEVFIQDTLYKIKQLITPYPEQRDDTISKDSNHNSTSSSSSSNSSDSSISCLSFSTKSTLSTSIGSTFGTRSSEPYEQEVIELVDKLRKQIQEKDILLMEHKKNADLAMNLDLKKIQKDKDELNRLRCEVADMKKIIFIDICKEEQVKEIKEIKSSIYSYIKKLQETYITRESAYILQSASLETQIQKVCKEHDYLTQNLIDFKLERQKYQQEIKRLKLEKYQYLIELNDYKVVRLSESKLRKEFRELMKNVKENHKREMLIELRKQTDLEQTIKNIKEDIEIKKWDKVEKSVQTNYPII